MKARRWVTRAEKKYKVMKVGTLVQEELKHIALA
jgi:hypothetical protein